MVHHSVHPLLLLLTCAWLQLIMFGSCFGGYCFLPFPWGMFSCSLHFAGMVNTRASQGAVVQEGRRCEHHPADRQQLVRGRVPGPRRDIPHVLRRGRCTRVLVLVCFPSTAEGVCLTSSPSVHISRRCRPQRSSSRFVLLPQLKSERSERPLHAITSTLTPTWSCLSER